jgi:filamentous hemagglutinin
LSLTAEPGAHGNATARVSTLDAGENITLGGGAVYLQATTARSGGDTSIVANGGSIVLDGARSSVVNYVPQERVNQLQQALGLTDVAISEANANPDLHSAQNEARAATQGIYGFSQMIGHPGLFEMVNNERERFLNGETADFLRTQTNLPYYSSLRASAYRLRPHHQRLMQLQAEKVQLERQLAILGGPVAGHENRGVDVSAKNVSMTAAGGIAVNGAQVRGTGRVELRSAGTLPLAEATSSDEQRNPVGIALAGIVDYYEGGQAGSARHVWMTAARPSVIDGALGVQIQAVGGSDARLAINSTEVRSSNGSILLQSQGNMRIESGQTESYFYGQHSYKSGGWFNRKSVTETNIDHNMRALPVSLDAQNVHLKSGGSIEAFATQFRAPTGQVQITAAHGLSLYAVPELQYRQNDVQKRSSFLGIAHDKSKSVDTRRVGSELPAKLVAEGVYTSSGWNTLLHGTVFQTGLGGANISVGVGESARADASIILNGARRIVTASRTVESNQVVWQSQAGSGSTSESLMLPTFDGPTSPILNGPVLAQIPQGDFKTQLELLGRQPGMAYIRTIANTNNLNWQPVKLAFEQWDYKQEGLTGAGAILIALAVTVATQGVGASLVGPSATTSQVVAGGTVTKFTTTGIMANAAFSSIAAQAAVTAANYSGDIGKTLRTLASTDTVKSALFAAAVAGSMAYTDTWGTTETINDNKLVTDWGQRSQAFLVNTAVKGALTGANKASDWWTIAGLSLATEAFKYWVGREGDVRPGVNSKNPVSAPLQEDGHFRVQRVLVDGEWRDTNNVGLGQLCTSAFAICQGKPISNALNITPGFNSFATLHDTWGNWLGHVKLWNGITNIGSMPPSLVIAYAHLADQYRYAMPSRR